MRTTLFPSLSLGETESPVGTRPLTVSQENPVQVVFSSGENLAKQANALKRTFQLLLTIEASLSSNTIQSSLMVVARRW